MLGCTRIWHFLFLTLKPVFELCVGLRVDAHKLDERDVQTFNTSLQCPRNLLACSRESISVLSIPSTFNQTAQYFSGTQKVSRGMRFFLLATLTLLMAAAGIRATLGLDAILKPRLYYLRYILFNSTLWIKRIEHRKWNRRRNGLHQLGQPVTPTH